MSIHDGVIVGYTVDFLKQEMLLNIETVTDDIVTVTFEDHLAHSFNHVMAGSIIFDIEEVDLSNFLKQNRDQFEYHKLYSWPTWYDDVNELKEYLLNNNYKCYIITASLGLTGYILAKTFKLRNNANFKKAN